MAWTPASLFGVADTGGWFDAADLGTLFQDSAGTVPVTGDTQPVGLIKAKAGTGAIGFHLAQSTSTAKPTFKTSAGQSWLQFDGGDWLDSGLSRFGRAGLHAASSESWTVVVAIRAHPNGAYVGGTYVARAGSTSANKTFQLYTASGLHGWVLRGTVTSNITAAAGVLGVRWDGAAAKIRFGNAEQAGAVGTASEESTQRILVGARSNGAGSLLSAGGSIAQVLFIDRALSAVELDNLYWYFAQRIGQTGVGAEPANNTHTPGGTSVGLPLVAQPAPATQAHAAGAATAALALSASSGAVVIRQVLPGATHVPALVTGSASITNSHAPGAVSASFQFAATVGGSLSSAHGLVGASLAPVLEASTGSLVQRQALGAAAFATPFVLSAPLVATRATPGGAARSAPLARGVAAVAQEHALPSRAVAFALTMTAPPSGSAAIPDGAAIGMPLVITATAATCRHVLGVRAWGAGVASTAATLQQRHHPTPRAQAPPLVSQAAPVSLQELPAAVLGGAQAAFPLQTAPAEASQGHVLAPANGAFVLRAAAATSRQAHVAGIAASCLALQVTSQPVIVRSRRRQGRPPKYRIISRSPRYTSKGVEDGRQPSPRLL